jgi:hypothetical protein
MKASSQMAADTLSLIDTAHRTLAVQTLGIDLESYRQAMVDAVECEAAAALLVDHLKGRDGGMALLLDSIRARLELVAAELCDTGRAMGIEAASA